MYPNLTLDTAQLPVQQSRNSCERCPHLPWQDKSTTTTPPRKAAFQNFYPPESFVMSFPHPKAMNSCWPARSNPREPERGTTHTHTQQAEGTSQDLEPATPHT
ncbi:hypothetical protein FBY31_0294 [Arthrobacter sp. SLBN-100]|jgi:hypothetical protein|nr:hypothetical protein FBY31_0294 [Arthrobacter sp. SLBN-100]